MGDLSLSFSASKSVFSLCIPPYWNCKSSSSSFLIVSFACLKWNHHVCTPKNLWLLVALAADEREKFGFRICERQCHFTPRLTFKERRALRTHNELLHTAQKMVSLTCSVNQLYCYISHPQVLILLLGVRQPLESAKPLIPPIPLDLLSLLCSRIYRLYTRIPLQHPFILLQPPKQWMLT